jgi:hypothetical protein
MGPLSLNEVGKKCPVVGKDQNKSPKMVQLKPIPNPKSLLCFSSLWIRNSNVSIHW